MHPTLADLELLLSSDDANKPPEVGFVPRSMIIDQSGNRDVNDIKVEAMSSEFKEELSRMETGSVALVYSDPNSDLTVEVMKDIYWRLLATIL